MYLDGAFGSLTREKQEIIQKHWLGIRISFVISDKGILPYSLLYKTVIQQYSSIQSSDSGLQLVLQILKQPQNLGQSKTHTKKKYEEDMQSQSGANPLPQAGNKATFASRKQKQSMSVDLQRAKLMRQRSLQHPLPFRKEKLIVVSERRLLQPFQKSSECETIYSFQVDPSQLKTCAIPFQRLYRMGSS